jgi:hypothetical protein
MDVRVILNSYKGAKGKIATINGATNPIETRRGVKQVINCLQYYLIFASIFLLKNYLLESLKRMIIIEFKRWSNSPRI